MIPASGSRKKPLEVTLTLTIGLEAGFVEDGLLCLFDHSALEAGIVDQRTATRWISILKNGENMLINFNQASA